ncbi:MAG: four helix bundle protein [Bacteroidales bacterium]|nr:four helix bundle protein [Bacteroidales bacterium]
MNYRDLEIYKLAFKLAIEVHNLTLKIPKFELYEEGSQIRRSSKSIGANIVEGYGKRSYKKDFLRSLTISHAECDETIYHLDILFATKSLIDKEKYDYLNSEYIKLSKMIYNFSQSVLKKHISDK